MHRNRWPVVRTIGLLLLLLPPGLKAAQPQPSSAGPATASSNSITSESDLVQTRAQLLALLRMSPTLADVVASDPTLLSSQEYVARTNPELAKFLQSHPEIVRNPDFYLFADFPPGPGRRRADKLVRRPWPGEIYRQEEQPSLQLLRIVGPFIILLTLVGTLLWLVRILLENRRWSRIFKLQTEVHGRLIDRFGNNEELLSYMSSEPGRRFLEAAPIPIDFEHDRRLPATLSRVLASLQIGVVLTLLGIGLLALRHSLPEISEALLVCGIVVLMPGIGFILSAGITWLLSTRLGLMPGPAQEPGHTGDRP